MSLPSALARVSEIQSSLGAPAQTARIQRDSMQTAPAQFSPYLNTAAPLLPLATSSVTPQLNLSGNVGERIVALAQAELNKGVRESSGNNDSPDIARYRTATQGAMAGAPWCAYFVSYLAREAGAPIGDGGKGIGYVPTVMNWAQRTGHWVSKNQGARPGDLVVFNQHIGIVESVGPNGQITTIEGNSSNAVSRRTNREGAAIGFVRLG